MRSRDPSSKACEMSKASSGHISVPWWLNQGSQRPWAVHVRSGKTIIAEHGGRRIICGLRMVSIDWWRRLSMWCLCSRWKGNGGFLIGSSHFTCNVLTLWHGVVGHLLMLDILKAYCCRGILWSQHVMYALNSIWNPVEWEMAYLHIPRISVR